MRKIEKQMLDAILAQRDAKIGNTRVVARDGFMDVFLHENHIASVRILNGLVWAICLDWGTLHNWPTHTTASRVNAICSLAPKGRAGYPHGVQIRNGKIVPYFPPTA